MFEGKTALELLQNILQIGGFTMYILLFCSFLSITILIERIIYYKRRSRPKRTEFMAKIKRIVKGGSFDMAKDFCRASNTPFSKVVFSGLELHARSEKEIANAMDREIKIETNKLERFISIVGTIGNTAVYIGLFGTVLGIIRAFKDIAGAGAGGMSIVIEGVAEALVCTAMGLLVAVPAVIAYNYFIRRIERFINDMELCASELTDLIGGEK